MTKLREYNLGNEAIASLVREVLSKEKDSYAGIRMRCVAIEKGGNWLNGLCLIEGVLRQNNVQKSSSIKYKGVYLLEQWIEPDKLPAILESIVQGALAIDGHSISLDSQQRFNQWEQVPSENNYSHFPGHLFTTSGSATLSLSGNAPLLSANNPFYANLYLAIRDWIRISNFSLSNDSRLGTIQLFLPHSRAYFDQIVREGDELVLSVEGSVESGLLVKGAWEFSKTVEQVDLSLKLERDILPWVENSEGLELYLIGPDDTVYDFHRETAFWSISHRRLFGTRGQESEGSRGVEDLLLQGEGEQTEFKPFIEPDDSSKLQEIVRTTIAFANKKGGTILLGVDNVCEVIGVEKKIMNAARRQSQTQEQAFDRYMGTVRQAIANDLNATPEINMEYVSLHGHKILVIRVPEGDRKPYWHIPSSQIYVRRGANTVKAHPEFDLPKLINSPLAQTELYEQGLH